MPGLTPAARAVWGVAELGAALGEQAEQVHLTRR